MCDTASEAPAPPAPAKYWSKMLQCSSSIISRILSRSAEAKFNKLLARRTNQLRVKNV
jgi:hypothetical protein